MKKLLYLCIAILPFISSCNKSTGYVLEADIIGANNIMFDLRIVENGTFVVVDSAMSENDGFVMKGELEYPSLVYLFARNTNYRASFYMENSKIHLKGMLDSLDVMEITGSSIQDEYRALASQILPLSMKYDSLSSEYQVARLQENDEQMLLVEKELDAVFEQVNTVQVDFIRENPSSAFAPFVLNSLSQDMETDEVESLIANMSPEIVSSPIIVSLKASIEKRKAVAIGQKAPDFTLNDVDGNPVSLSSKVGTKILLVDFWAGWCNPCRLENPNVVKVYNEFHKKGFDVFGVSLDRTKDEWVKAIADDKLTWTHVSDLQFWQNAAAQLYMVNSIPANFLLDENGVIIDKNLRGEELYNKVQELLK